MTKKLYESMGKASIVIFGGDTSSDSALTIYFYKQFMRRYDYEKFKEFKKKIYQLKNLKKKLSSRDDSVLVQKSHKINIYIDKRKKVLPEFYEALIQYKYNYRAHDTFETAWEYFKKVKSYSKFSIADGDIEHINETLRLLNISDDYASAMCAEYNKYPEELRMITAFEEKYGKVIEDISLSDYKHVLLEGVYAVLIPNQNGLFCECGNLYVDVNLLEEYKLILNELGTDAKSWLLHLGLEPREWFQCKEYCNEDLLKLIELQLEQAEKEKRELIFLKLVFMYSKEYSNLGIQKQVCTYQFYGSAD